jgi:hypothetical protein
MELRNHHTIPGGLNASVVKHPQIEVNGIWVDEKIAPLIAQAHKMGISTRWSCQGGDDPPYALAYITFPKIADAVEFLTATAHNMDYAIGDNLALSVHRELAMGEGPGGKVTWHPHNTPRLIDAWR